MKRVILFAAIGAFIGCLLLVLIHNPFVVLGYFGFYLIATITVFSIFFDKLKGGYVPQVSAIFQEERGNPKKM